MTRTIFEISGADRVSFLENLVSNTLSPATYAALLTPQGKFLADFFLRDKGAYILLDVDQELAPGLFQRLNMYKLRSDVMIANTDLKLVQGFENMPPDGYADPRHPALGWRAYRDEADIMPLADWNARRVEHLIPESNIELIPNETYILEAGFERLNGVDFRKGCYVGQEITARMKHKTTLKKGFVKILLSEQVPVGTEITADGKAIGKAYTQSGDQGIAHVRFDRLTTNMRAGNTDVSVIETE